jgi:hypothetical protein
MDEQCDEPCAAHSGWILDLLGLIELGPTRHAGGVVVTDNVLVRADAADDVAIQDLHMVDVEEELELGGADLLESTSSPK